MKPMARSSIRELTGLQSQFAADVRLRAHGPVVSKQLTLSAVCGAAAMIVWIATGTGYFWPMWVWLGLAIPAALGVGIRWAWAEPPGRQRRVAMQGALSAILAGTQVAIWAMAGGGFFWPVFPLLALAGAFAVHAVLTAPRGKDLAGRVDELTRTRRGALDVQAAELRRIERDLHDGAQARLVALSMQLGRAEERLEDRPETAALVRRAREEATAAIAELRDLARGIAPPVLADRGLVAAVRAIAERSSSTVNVVADVSERPPPVVETAAYFVVAESLTNAAKHAPSAVVKVTLRSVGTTLQIEVADDGAGGADPAGGGLTGLRQRVEALDGALVVASAPGQGTTITAELPCA
jgi:signal transduction histidine kinase